MTGRALPQGSLARLREFRQAFRQWRRTRPFWGGVIAILAGAEMYGLTAAPFQLLLIQGVAGISALIIFILMLLLAVTTWFQPHLRSVTGMIVVVLALASILLTNLGGFLVGMLLGLHGGATMVGWKPVDPQTASRGSRFGRGSRTPGRPSPAKEPAVGSLLPGAPDTPGDRQSPPGGSLPGATVLPGRAADAPTASMPVSFAPPAAAAPRPSAPEPPTSPSPGAPAGQPDDDEYRDRSTPPGGISGLGGLLRWDSASSAGESRVQHVRRRGSLGGLAVILVLAGSLMVTPAQRAAAATGSGTTVLPPKSVFCTLLAVLCPATTTTDTTTATPTSSADPTATSTSAPTTSSSTSGTTGATGTTGTATTASTTGTSTTGTSGTATASPSPTVTPTTACGATPSPSASASATTSADQTSVDMIQACIAAKATAATSVSGALTSGGAISPLPTHLTATKQTMTGLGYGGVVTLATSAGDIQALKFTASSVKIEGMHEDVADVSGTMALVPGGTVTLSGKVQLYVLKQSGKVFGLLPLTLSPAFPPPLVLPIMTFTDVDSQIAFIQADSLTVPGTSINVTGA